MAVSFEGRLTREDYRRAFELHLRPAGVARRLWEAFVALVALIVLLALLRATFSPASGQALLGQSLPLLALLAIVAAWPWWYPQALAASQYSASRAAAGWERGEVGEQGLQVASDGLQGVVPWQTYKKYRRSPDMVLLYYQNDAFVLLSRARFRSEADWQAFVALVERHVPEAGQVKHALPLQGILLVGLVALLLAVTVSRLFPL